MAPRLSVVIASVAGGIPLRDCVDSFARQRDQENPEIVVAASDAADVDDMIARGWSGVRLLRAETRSIPDLRALGLLAATGDIAAMTEDHCLAGEQWVDRVLRAHEAPHLVIGGAVENAATERLLDWAVYFCEYHRYMQPVPTGPAADLPGPNVSYKRAALDEFRDLLRPATWEPFWHWRLLDRGVRLISDPAIVVYHRKHFTLRAFLSERYHYSRSFAGCRVSGSSWGWRLLLALGTPLLPPLLIGRMVACVFPKRRWRRQFLAALPLIALFTLVWAVGEFIGYLSGPADSLERIT